MIVIAVGAHKSWKLDIEGEDLSGVWGAVEFLREVNLGKKVNVGSKVAIVGGGNSAIDAARTAMRLGAKDVTILYRRERKDMPAWENEIVAAEHEGVKIEYLVAPIKLIGKGGKLAGVECQRMKLGEFDRSGRRKPVAIAGSEFALAIDTIVPAISQSTDASFIAAGSDVSMDKWGGIKAIGKAKNKTTADERIHRRRRGQRAGHGGRGHRHGPQDRCRTSTASSGPGTTSLPTGYRLRKSSRSPSRWTRRSSRRPRPRCPSSRSRSA
ncbi:MAG: FAD-dependent oxidoreductase [Comamonadaceae bacterium]|nr:FAD-dependent oxidoreductase [Comamonadaceae bacterium]